MIAKIVCTLFIVTLSATGITYAHKNHERTISASGTGEVKVIPDQAQVSGGVVSTGETVSEALDKNNNIMKDIFSKLDKFGIAKADVKTSNFSVYPTHAPYDPQLPPNNGIRPIIGYEVNNTLTILVRDVNLLGNLLDTMVRYGSNQIGNIQFIASDTDKIVDKAKQLAIKNAIHEAKIYAKASGVTLGSIISISENNRYPRQEYSRSTAITTMSANVNISPGTHSVSSSISIVFNIKE